MTAARARNKAILLACVGIINLLAAQLEPQAQWLTVAAYIMAGVCWSLSALYVAIYINVRR